MMVSFFFGDDGVFGRAAVVSIRSVGSGCDLSACSLASWAGNASGPTTTLYFAAGPDDEAHGLFGRIDVVR